MTRDERVVLARGPAVRLAEPGVAIALRDAQSAAMATQLADGTEQFERRAPEPAKHRHPHSRNGSHSSKGDAPGGAAG
ncbi:hypothetical protein P1P75_11430 [Streptomyces sp. ID05-39B]|uniref:hypothetical protein n=1 Tax=Streptomyces sp. ID05-39B TaxID=3028664 RepID=UPI0029BC0A08|nr:hypothetical protein [Streptomyces sp. ID05-39B]MDX3527034.1 hypothetical protein [Streptomyces sp. ID05-39B]